MYPNLKLQLWTLGLRQNRLAKMLNVDETLLSKIVNGFREPSTELQNSIASLLKRDVDWLFKRADNASEKKGNDGHTSITRS